jgi:ParB-like chromosome segregation protein Spo0J
MATMKEAAKKNLEKMVKGAAREVSSSRPGAQAPVANTGSAENSSRAVSKAVYQQLLDQITKHGKTIQKVPVESIRLHENIRESYQTEAMQALVHSMEKEGLIQYPTICLKDEGSEPAFVCKNGHRRVLAAKQLGWKTIECIILPFASARDELYHTIAANLREDVFYLDLAAAYQQASRLGETDQAIADRVGVNLRTVSWYRRLTKMSPECQSLCRLHPELFHATWAIKLARQGELPPPAVLLKQMQVILARQQALSSGAGSEPKSEQSKEQKQAAREQLKQIFTSDNSNGQVQFAWNLLNQLTQAGLVSPKQLERIRRQYAPGASKSSSRTRAAEKTA